MRIGFIDQCGIGHIPLTQGKEALCDAQWFPILSQWNWNAHFAPNNKKWYAMRVLDGCYMARVVLGITKPKIHVDHRDTDATLDNREANLRLANPSQNGYNRTKMSNGCLVLFRTFVPINVFEAIRVNTKLLHLGLFNTPIEAAAIYNFAATRLHGEFAALKRFKRSGGH